MTQIKKILDKQGDEVFIRTSTKAVVDGNGYTAESRLQAMQDEINQAQLEVGAVPSDLTPTEGSTNWVTSDGLYKQLNKGTTEQVEMSEVFLGNYYLDNGTVTAHNFQYTYYIPVLKDEKYLISLEFPTARALRSAFFEDIPSVGDEGTNYMISESDATEFEREVTAPYDGYLAFSFYKSKDSDIISRNVYHIVSHIVNIPSDYYNNRDNINAVTNVTEKTAVDTIDGVMISDGVITSHNAQMLYCAKVRNGDILYIKASASEEVALRYGQVSSIPSVGDNVSDYHILDGNLTHEFVYTASSDGYFVCSFYYLGYVSIRKVADVGITYNRVIDKTDVQQIQKFSNVELAANGIIELPQNYIRKNTVLKASVTYMSGFSQISVGRGYGNIYQSHYVVINADNIVVHQYTTSDTIIGTYAHGLTLSDSATVIINASLTTATITLLCNGSIFTTDEISWLGGGSPFVKNTGANSITVDNLSFAINDIDKKTWIFGDSYTGYWSNERWTYWMIDWGFDNWMCDSLPGASSRDMYTCFQNDISLNTPSYALWLLGMNDSTSSSASIYQTKTCMDYFAKECISNGIVPILATIPSVPSKDKSAVNTWVRNSGYRYIDFAAAVNTNESTGTWKTGMLSSDNVHPTELGAKQLATRVLMDFPEIMMK